MTDNFYAPPHSIEAEQAVIGGLLLDDDSSERVQKVLAMLKPDSFYSRPHKILFEEITRMHREQKPVDGLTLFDELERKSQRTRQAQQTSLLMQCRFVKPQWNATPSTA